MYCLLGSDQVVCGLLLLVRRPKVQQLLWFCKQECSCSGSVAHTLLFSCYVAVWFQNVAKSSRHFWQDDGRRRMNFEWHKFCGVSTKATNNLQSLWKLITSLYCCCKDFKLVKGSKPCCSAMILTKCTLSLIVHTVLSAQRSILSRFERIIQTIRFHCCFCRSSVWEWLDVAVVIETVDARQYNGINC